MKVKELINKLLEFDMEQEVGTPMLIHNDDKNSWDYYCDSINIEETIDANYCYFVAIR